MTNTGEESGTGLVYGMNASQQPKILDWNIFTSCLANIQLLLTNILASFLPSHVSCRPQYKFSCGRSSPIWRPSHLAMMCPVRPHTARLAQPKQTHPDYCPSRQVSTPDSTHIPCWSLCCAEPSLGSIYNDG